MFTSGRRNTDPQFMDYPPWTTHMDYPKMEYTTEVQWYVVLV